MSYSNTCKTRANILNSYNGHENPPRKDMYKSFLISTLPPRLLSTHVAACGNTCTRISLYVSSKSHKTKSWSATTQKERIHKDSNNFTKTSNHQAPLEIESKQWRHQNVLNETPPKYKEWHKHNCKKNQGTNLPQGKTRLWKNIWTRHLQKTIRKKTFQKIIRKPSEMVVFGLQDEVSLAHRESTKKRLRELGQPEAQPGKDAGRGLTQKK